MQNDSVFSSTLTNRYTWLVPYVIIFAVSLPILLSRLPSVPLLWSDEGWSMHAARTLAERGIYGTYQADRVLPFDPVVSTGPTVIIPLAITDAVFGLGIVQSRLLVVLFALIGLFLIFRLSSFLYGDKVALLSTLCVIAFPSIQGLSYMFYGRQVLGEVPGIMFIVLGLLLWYKRWDRSGLATLIISGVAIGLGVITKMQYGVAILPAITVVVMARYIRSPRKLIRTSILLMVAVGVILAWIIVQRVGVPADLRAEYSDLFAVGGQLHFLTGSMGRFLTRNGMYLVVVAAVAVFSAVWRLFRNWLNTDQEWGEITLILIISITTVWFVLLSIGWPRYMLMALTLSLILLGKTVFDILVFVQDKIIPSIRLQVPLYWLSIALLGVFGLAVNLYELSTAQNSDSVVEMGQYIAINVPRDAVIESWEWEVDALSQHWNYHHPDTTLVYEAIRQRFHMGVDPELIYDPLQADPDYLLKGAFSDWNHMYDQAAVDEYFNKLVQIGHYQLYQRKQSASD